MKILHLIDIPWWSGLSAYAFDSVSAHLSSGHQIWIACQKNSLSHKKSLELNLQTIPIAGRKSWDAVSNFISIGLGIAHIKPDCIVAHTGSTHWIAWWWGTQSGTPVIRTRAISQPVQKSAINEKIYSDSYRIVAASEKLKNECLNRLSANLEEKIYTIYPPVNAPAFDHCSSLSDQEHIQNRAAVNNKIGILARLDPAKGYSDFLRMAKIVQERTADTEFHIAGSEENLKWHTILKNSKTLGLRNIFYHGFLPHEKVWAFLRNCAVGVIASRGSEEVSRALLEWMSAGKPVVATAVGCISEILKDGAGGFLVAPNDPEQMAEKVAELLSNASLATKMGSYNIDLCEARFSKKKFQSEWEKILPNRKR